MSKSDDNEKGIKPEYYFDEELKSFALHLESEETMEIEEIGNFFIKFGQGLKSGEVPMFDPDDEVVVH